jgi:hypothetical protein
VLVALVCFGGLLRAHGFTSKDLWFDDAWVAAATKLSATQLLHVGLAAPGYTFLLRGWVAMDPTSTFWLQLPAFVLGVLAIPAIWLLLRWMRMGRWIAVGGALLVTVMPILVQYSTRLKEYPFDFLAACVLLGVYEGLRSEPSRRRLAMLGVASSVAVLVSAGCLVVVAAIWGLVLVTTLRTFRWVVVVWGAVVAASGLVTWLVFVRSLPPSLHTYWRVRGYLFDFHSLATAEKSVSLGFGGFLHEAFGVPASPSFFRYSDGLHSTPLTVAGVACVAVLVGVPIVASVRARAVTPALPSALVLALAVVLAVVSLVPFGDGRTDEVLYPAMIVCLASIARLVATRLAATRLPAARLKAGAAAGAVVFAIGVLLFGALHPADYPSIDLRGVSGQLDGQLRPGERVFVSTFDSFGWCYYRLSPCTVVLDGSPRWIQGFRPVSTDPAVFIAPKYQSVLPQMLAAMHGTKPIWYVGFTYGTYDVASKSSAQDQPVVTQMLRVLARHGWRLAPAGRATPNRLDAPHTFAWLFVHAPQH